MLHPTVPGTPNALVSSVVNSSVLFVSWQVPTVSNGIITGYILYYSISTTGNCTASGNSHAFFSVPGQTAYNATLNNLVPFSMYALCVQASIRIGSGALSMAVVITTDPDSSSPPTNFTATPLNSTSIRITWGYPMSPQGLIAGYQIVGNTSLLLYPVTINISTNNTSQQTYRFGGLIPNTAYYFAVRAYGYNTRLNVSTQIYGSYSQQLVLNTLQDSKTHVCTLPNEMIYIPYSSFNASKLPALCNLFHCPYGHLGTSYHTQWDYNSLHNILYSITEPDLP